MQGLSAKDYLKLLAAEFNEDRQLTIVGYPKEFGNNSELISIEVQDRLGNRKEDYDTTVVRTDFWLLLLIKVSQVHLSSMKKAQ